MYRTLAFDAALACVLAVLNWPYGYYQLLRFGVCAVAIYRAALAHRAGAQGWTWALGALAVVFNPVLPVYLDWSVWTALDVGAAVVLALSARAVHDRKP